MSARAVVLVILDGFGLAPAWGGNAIAEAKTPTIDSLEREPHAVLQAAGEAVGLQPGEPGNSEVGHLNLGAGRIVVQQSRQISEALTDRSFFANPVLNDTYDQVKQLGTTLHLMGLLSPVGIHAVYNHLLGLLELAKNKNLPQVKIHLFTDGRDSGQRDALALLLNLERVTSTMGVGTIQTISGRYYAMDRDEHWERTEAAFEAIVFGRGLPAASARQALAQAYAKDQSDEFIVPTVINPDGKIAYRGVQAHDALVFFNCRADRARQLTRTFMDDELHPSLRSQLPGPLEFVTLVPYDLPSRSRGARIAFTPPTIGETLAGITSARNARQFHIAETEKWAHVTYFFNGRLEAILPGEERLLLPSPKVPTYDLDPAMSAEAITREVIRRVQEGKETLIVVNYANADMVGHTGNFRAAIAAVETLDRQVGRLSEACQAVGIPLLVTADHGNVEEMVNPETGEVDTEHTSNPVPCYFVLPNPLPLIKPRGFLADVAPTLLALLGYPIPSEITGTSILQVEN